MVWQCNTGLCRREFTRKNGLARHTATMHGDVLRSASSRYAAPQPPPRPAATTHSSDEELNLFDEVLKQFQMEEGVRARPAAERAEAFCTRFLMFFTTYVRVSSRFSTAPFPSNEDALVAELVMQTHMSKTDANLLYKMLHSPGFNINDLVYRNVQSMHAIVDELVDQVTFLSSSVPLRTRFLTS